MHGKLQLNFFRFIVLLKRSGSARTEHSQKDVLAQSEEAEMFRSSELNSVVSGSKFSDWESVFDARCLLTDFLC